MFDPFKYRAYLYFVCIYMFIIVQSQGIFNSFLRYEYFVLGEKI